MVDKSKAQNGTKWKPSVKQIAIVEMLLNPEDRRSKGDKLKEAGVPHRTFYNWMKDKRFIDYMNSKLDLYTDGELSDIWKALINQCKRGNIQAIKLFFEMKELTPNKIAAAKQKLAEDKFEHEQTIDGKRYW